MMLYKSMNEKELKKLNRKQLLELLLQQTEHADSLQLQLDETKRELENRILQVNEAGSIAEASLELNGVFEAAQAAAQQYLENIQHLEQKQLLRQKQIDEEYLKKAKKMFAEIQQRCEAYETECREKADKIVAETEERCRKRDRESRRVLAEVKHLHQRLMEKKQEIDQK